MNEHLVGSQGGSLELLAWWCQDGVFGGPGLPGHQLVNGAQQPPAGHVTPLGVTALQPQLLPRPITFLSAPGSLSSLDLHACCLSP